MRKTMEAAMLTAQEKIPGYPSKPAGSSYARTGTLGRTLGVGQTGGAIGKPEIFVQKRIGQARYEGTIGTGLHYAQYVIGERQARHMTHWWTVKTWSRLAAKKIQRLYNNTMNQLARWIEGR
jgi:hypothetical protein